MVINYNSGVPLLQYLYNLNMYSSWVLRFILFTIFKFPCAFLIHLKQKIFRYMKKNACSQNTYLLSSKSVNNFSLKATEFSRSAKK